MNLSQNGENFLKSWEGLRLRAYRDAFGKLTIGYGHLIAPSEEAMYLHLKQLLTGEEATALFEKDAQRFINAVNAALKDAPRVKLNQNQFDALVAFVFNIGINGWNGSTARRDLINGMLSALPGELKRWVHDEHGNVCDGLQNRRNAEITLFNKPITK